MTDQLFLFVFATATFLLAGTIKGTIGIGMPTAAIGMLTQVIEPRTAIALVVFPTFISNAWQIFRMGEIARATRDYWIFALSLMVMLWMTTSLTVSVSERSLMLIIGLVVVMFSLTSLFISPPHLPDKFDSIAQLILGTIAGVIGGLTAVWAAPIVIYLLAKRADKDEFIRATGFLITCGSVPLVLGFLHRGLLDAETVPLSAFLVLPALLGFWVGEALRRRLPVEKFQSTVLVIFLLMGLNIIRRALM